MPEQEKPVITTAEIRDYLVPLQGKDVNLNQIRSDLGIEKGSVSWGKVPNIMFQLEESKVVRWVRREEYRVITPVVPVRVFAPDRTDRPPFELFFPRNFDTMMELDFAQDIVIREGDIILIAGMSNYFKTGMCLNFAGENIDKHPVLMGNEYTVMTSEEERKFNPEKKYDVSPRFYNRVKAMKEWVEWTNGDGSDKFTLLPVWDDYAEHIIKDRINIIDWINLPGEYYMISPLMEKCKKAVGRGILIPVIQKAEGVTHGRGGAMTREFADVEILLDNFGKNEVLLTIGKVKESIKPVVGRTFAFGSGAGVKILNFREVKKCPTCHQGFVRGQPCDDCGTKKFIDK